MTQHWGTPTGSNPGSQQWPPPAQWNRPTQPWGAPTGSPWPQAAPTGPQRLGPQSGSQASYPTQYPSQGQQPYYSPQPPRRGGGATRLILGLGTLVGIALVGLVLANLLNSPQVHVPKPDTSPPALPQPTTYGEAEEWVINNSFYQEALAGQVDCAVPELDMTTASVDELEDHLNQLTACLWRVWDKPVEDSGYQLPRPPVTVYNQPITTGCGELDDVNAVYCAADQRIYYAKPLWKIFPKDQQQQRFVVESVLAHEFGHTLQARTGILISGIALEQNSTTENQAKQISRRIEVQADCLSGMFVYSVADASQLNTEDLESLGKVFYNLGDDVLTGKPNYVGDHGLGASREYWYRTGLASQDVGKCNTFLAPPAEVR